MSFPTFDMQVDSNRKTQKFNYRWNYVYFSLIRNKFKRYIFLTYIDSHTTCQGIGCIQNINQMEKSAKNDAKRVNYRERNAHYASIHSNFKMENC